jgi:arsenite-transporting ATPase
VAGGETGCPRFKNRIKETKAARKFLQTHFANARVFTAEDPGCPILGVDALRRFGTHVFAGEKLPASVPVKPPKHASVSLEKARWPALTTPLTLTAGKGGVGKTTISAALAFHHRHIKKDEVVTICSIDPAPSLRDVFAAKIDGRPQPVLRDPKLRAVEFEAMAKFQQWAEALRRRLNEALTAEDHGIHIDISLDRRFLLSLLEVVPPGIDEIFAIFEILDLLQDGGRVVIDMAPTGHAVELLRTPTRLLAWTRLLLKTLAAHRTLPLAQDAAVEVATLSQNTRQLSAILRDRKRNRMTVVTLPEPLPDYETRRLLRDLAALRVPIGAVFINRVLIQGGVRCPRCKLTEQWQSASLASLRRELRGAKIYVAREFESPIAGAKDLRQFTAELWRLK